MIYEKFRDQVNKQGALEAKFILKSSSATFSTELCTNHHAYG